MMSVKNGGCIWFALNKTEPGVDVKAVRPSRSDTSDKESNGKFGSSYISRNLPIEVFINLCARMGAVPYFQSNFARFQ